MRGAWRADRVVVGEATCVVFRGCKASQLRCALNSTGAPVVVCEYLQFIGSKAGCPTGCTHAASIQYYVTFVIFSAGVSLLLYKYLYTPNPCAR